MTISVVNVLVCVDVCMNSFRNWRVELTNPLTAYFRININWPYIS